MEKIKYKNYHGRRVPVKETFAHYSQNGYFGPDADLETSLLEYSLIAGKNKHCEKDELHFIYFVGDLDYEEDDGSMTPMRHYGHGYMTKKDMRDKILTDGWFEFEAFAQWSGYLGTAEEYVKQFLESDDQAFFHVVFDAMLYYGYENIIGIDYYPFPIFKYGGYNQ